MRGRSRLPSEFPVEDPGCGQSLRGWAYWAYFVKDNERAVLASRGFKRDVRVYKIHIDKS